MPVAFSLLLREGVREAAAADRASGEVSSSKQEVVYYRVIDVLDCGADDESVDSVQRHQ